MTDFSVPAHHECRNSPPSPPLFQQNTRQSLFMLGDWLLSNSHGNLSPLWLSEAFVSVPEHRCRAEANIVWELFAWVFWSGLECMRALWMWLWYSQSPRTVKDEKDRSMYYTVYVCISNCLKKKKHLYKVDRNSEIAWLLFYIEEATSWVRLNLLSRVTCCMAEPVFHTRTIGKNWAPTVPTILGIQILGGASLVSWGSNL